MRWNFKGAVPVEPSAVGRLSWAPVALLMLAGPSGCGEDDVGLSSAVAAQHCQPDNAATRYVAAATGSQGEALEGTAPARTACYQLTGYGSAENTLAIDSGGAVYVAPVFTADGHGVLRSRDLGESWHVMLPEARGGHAHDKPQPYMFMDPTTDRLFYANPGEDGFVMSYSDDGAETFQKTQLMEGTLDWLKVAVGPTPDGSRDNVMYAMAPAPISTPTPIPGMAQPDFQKVERSMDGGRTWSQVGGEMLSIVPDEHGCASSEWVIYGGGVVAPDGSVYFGLRRCQHLGIAISRDQGERWEVKDVPGSAVPAYGGLLSHLDEPNLLIPEPLAVDSNGNLFALWVDPGGALRMSVSRDRADTWSQPVAVAAPDAPFVVYPAASVSADGRLALAYFGSADGVTYHAYLAETDNALDPTPTFTGVRLNSAAEPLHSQGFDVGYATILSGGDLVEIVQVRHGPNGDIWAAFAADMCPGIGADDACGDWDPAAHGGARFQAAIGRLTRGAPQ